MSSHLHIEEIDDADTDAIAELWQRAGLTRAWNDPQRDIAFARTGPSSTILVGRFSGSAQPVASAMVGHDGHRGTVYYVAVDPDHHGAGLGRQMMSAVEAWLRGRGVWKLNLIVRADNEAVTAFYEHLGYAREERIILSKWLEEPPTAE
ncbi:MAG: GNAT family acetyltransferase [Hyphomicrobiales bacterium]|nr:GNAT family acetyltransferase [Hyphomicrobiales bacterium]